MKLKGSIIVILEVVIAIVVGVTIGFNFLKANNDNTNNNNQENNVHLNKILTDEKSNSFYGIYNENDLVINKNQNNGVISISGLKNKNIEKIE